MAEVESIELKFRIFDGTDVAHANYPSTTTVATIKERLVAEWPKGLELFRLFYILFVKIF